MSDAIEEKEQDQESKMPQSPPRPPTTQEIDNQWKADAKIHGWVLPRPVLRIFRLPLIRHIRATFVAYRMGQFYANHQQPGHPYDGWCLYAIWRGWC